MDDPYKKYSFRWFTFAIELYAINVFHGFENLASALYHTKWYESAVGLDKLCNSFIGGDPNETMSSRFGREGSSCKPCYWICMFLNLFQKDHCKKALESPKNHKNEIIDL